jgi:transcriptional regulator
MPRDDGLPPGTLVLLILRVLASRRLHGYAIAQKIAALSDAELSVEEGSLYPALQRMLRSGLVKAQWEVSATGRRVRVYQITPRGRSHLEREVSRFERMLEGIRLVLALEP